MAYCQLGRWVVFLVWALGTIWSGAVQALPSFARQTGQACVACHVSFPELTPYGRQFKLSGYTLGTKQLFPFSAMAVGSVSRTDNTQGNDLAYPKNGGAVLEGGSLFLAGKLSDHFGLFSQWTYNNLNAQQQPDGTTRFAGHTSADNTDIRLVDHITKTDLDLIYGMSLNNNPTVQDVWNSTPAFAYPFQTSRLAGVWGIGAPATLIEGGLAQQVAGLSAYAFLNSKWYLELGSYRNAEGVFSVLRRGVDVTNRLKGTNPYWRFAYNKEWGSQSMSVGTFGMISHVNADPLDRNSPTDRFRDVGVDMQYQYLADPHTVTGQLSLIHERVKWDGSHVGVDRQSDTSTLKSYRVKGSYWYQRTYGVTLGLFSQHGSEDNIVYPVTNRPDTNGFIAELNYMVRPNWRLGLQYTGYNKYLGATNNFDGNGRNARFNNTTYLYTWVAF